MQEVVDRHGSRAPSLTSHTNTLPPERSELELLFAAARRQAHIVIIGAILGIALGVGYLATAVPQYTASALVLLDTKRVRAVQDSYDVMALGFEGASPVDSQVEVLRSDSVVHSVVDKLQLVRDKEFRASRPSLLAIAISEFWRMLGFSRPAVEEVRALVDEESERRQVGNMLRGGLGARRLPRTLVLEISYTSPIPSKAADIANGFANAYLVDQLEAKYDANRRASEWLQNRIAELKQQALTSDLAVQRFKAAHNLTISGGRSIDEQQLGEVNSQLVIARAETARAEARYQRMKTILDGHQMDAVVSEAIGNSVIEQLRSKFVGAAKREADLLGQARPQPRLRSHRAQRHARIRTADVRGARAHSRALSQRAGYRPIARESAGREPQGSRRIHRYRQRDAGRAARARARSRDLQESVSVVPAAQPGARPAAIVSDHRGPGDLERAGAVLPDASRGECASWQS